MKNRPVSSDTGLFIVFYEPKSISLVAKDW